MFGIWGDLLFLLVPHWVFLTDKKGLTSFVSEVSSLLLSASKRECGNCMYLKKGKNYFFCFLIFILTFHSSQTSLSKDGSFCNGARLQKFIGNLAQGITNCGVCNKERNCC